MSERRPVQRSCDGANAAAGQAAGSTRTQQRTRRGAAHLERRRLHAILPAGALFRHQVGRPAQNESAAALPKPQLVAHSQRVVGAGRDARAVEVRAVGGACRSSDKQARAEATHVRQRQRRLRGVASQAAATHAHNTQIGPGSSTKAAPSRPLNWMTACSLRERVRGPQATVSAAARPLHRLAAITSSLRGPAGMHSCAHTRSLTASSRGGLGRGRTWVLAQRCSGAWRCRPAQCAR